MGCVMIVAAAGQSSRMGQPKQQILLGGAPVLLHTLRALQAADSVDGIVLAARAEDIAPFSAMARENGIDKLIAAVPGGATRQQSVAAGLRAVPETARLVGIHDGARPLVPPETIRAVVDAAAACGAAAAAVPVTDTLKRTDGDGFVTGTADRSGLWRVQTPQVFARAAFAAALAAAEESGADYTDDCQLMEHAGHRVRLIPGAPQNIKLTAPADVPLARALFSAGQKKEEDPMRIGHGYDVHRLVEDRPLILGGVRIPFERGLLGHSDADVLTHAVMDALLGAAALGDIGKLFPDSDPAFAGADSLRLLQTVGERIRAAGWQIGNIDATVLAQRPKLAPFIPQMRQQIADACGADLGRVSVKATTEEGLGFTGSGEGIAAHAVCLLTQR